MRSFKSLPLANYVWLAMLAIAVDAVLMPHAVASQPSKLTKPIPSSVEPLFPLTPDTASATWGETVVPIADVRTAVIPPVEEAPVAAPFPARLESAVKGETEEEDAALMPQALPPSSTFTTDAASLAAPFMPAEISPTETEPTVISQGPSREDEVPWRFVVEPYVYLPFETSGDITVRGTEVPYDYDLGDILESLTFAFYGRFEAWKGPWAFVFDGYYTNTVDSDATVVDTPPDLVGELPPNVTVESDAETAYTKLDFAAAYRFGDGDLADALRTADTEFDLGPFIFDAMAGVRLYFFNNSIDLSTDIGQDFDQSRSEAFIEPVIGGRARWNLAHNLAAIAAANISGFGIGESTFSLESYAGVDWMFSGNTSLTASYRITYIDWERDEAGLNFFQHGPALGMKFRF